MHGVHEEKSVLVHQQFSGAETGGFQRDQLSLTFPLTFQDIYKSVDAFA